MGRWIPKSPVTRLMLGIGIVAAGAFLFLASGYAQQNQSAPKPNATALAELTAIIQYYGGKTPEPLFAGEMNGFTFQRDSAPNFSACEGIRPHGTASDHGSAALAASKLDFNAAYVPAGFTGELVRPMSDASSGPLSVVQCGATIVSVTQRWTSSSGSIAITRQASSPIIQDRYSKDLLEPTTINGRPAIFIRPRFAGEDISVYLRDDHSFWSVNAKGVSLDELRKVAQAIN